MHNQYACVCALGALERRRDGEHHLLDYVECEARDLSGEPFTRFMGFLYQRIYSLIARCQQCIPGHATHLPARLLAGIFKEDDSNWLLAPASCHWYPDCSTLSLSQRC